MANGGLPSNIGQSSNAAANLSLGGGTLMFLGSTSGAGTTDRLFTVSASSSIDASGSVPLVFSNTSALAVTGTTTLTLTGTSTQANSLASQIALGTAVSLAKSGMGTWSLNPSSVELYTGTTTVSGGTLTLNYTGLATPTNLINSGSGLTLAGGTLNFTGKGATLQTFAGLTVNAGDSAIAVTSSSGTSVGVTLGAITRTALGGTVDFPASGTPTVSITTTTADANPAGGQQSMLGGYATFGGGSTWAVQRNRHVPHNRYCDHRSVEFQHHILSGCRRKPYSEFQSNQPTHHQFAAVRHHQRHRHAQWQSDNCDRRPFGEFGYYNRRDRNYRRLAPGAVRQ